MAEPDTAALVERLHARQDPLCEEAAQRLADAERNCAMFHVDEQVHDEEVKGLTARATRAEAALWEIARTHDRPQGAHYCGAGAVARAALTSTEEPEHG